MPGATDSSVPHHAVAERLAALVPVAVAQPVRRVLGDDAHDLGARPARRPRGRGRRARGSSPRRSGVSESAPYLAGVEGPLDGVDAGRHDDPAAESAAGRPRRPGSVGVPESTRLTLATTPGCPDVAGPPAQRRPDRDRIDELDERALGVERRRRRHAPRSPRPSQRDAGRSTVDRASRRRPRPPCGSRRRTPGPPPPAPRPAAPGPPVAIDRLARGATVVARGVGQQEGGRAARPRPEVRRSARRARRWPPGGRRSRRPRPRSRRRPSAGPAAAVRASSLPRPRYVRPSLRPARASPKPGLVMSGGVSSPRSARKRPSARTWRSKPA